MKVQYLRFAYGIEVIGLKVRASHVGLHRLTAALDCIYRFKFQITYFYWFNIAAPSS